ncbi:hypothetical protein [Vibrio lentus]|uniref:hypothetical protein n=1 Tax=Vibrio lentus TaxID=136468 RepID=UPI000C81709F|nr:hypothetical protein [Vibrio lentus]PMI89740.1 hypothetical protein BCU35_22935 [Vibrio lentus]PMJ02194.1 hypothetical protein BCU32_22840 [Vibrio lentus]
MVVHNVKNNNELNKLFDSDVVSIDDVINLFLITPNVVLLKVNSLAFSEDAADVILLEDAKGHFGTIQKDGSNVIHIFQTADSIPIQLHEYRA